VNGKYLLDTNIAIAILEKKSISRAALALKGFSIPSFWASSSSAPKNQDGS
jgi:predicted nucleic acid-binding protein